MSQIIRKITYSFTVTSGGNETHHLQIPPLINSRWILDTDFTPATNSTAGVETPDGAAGGSETLLTLTTTNTFELVSDPRTDLVEYIRLILFANGANDTTFRLTIYGIELPMRNG